MKSKVCFYGNREAAYAFAWAEINQGNHAMVTREGGLYYV